MNQTSWIQPKSGLFFCLWNRPPPRSTRTDALMPYTALSPTALAVGRSEDDRRLRAFGPRDAATDRAAAADARGRAERPPGSQHPAFRLACDVRADAGLGSRGCLARHAEAADRRDRRSLACDRADRRAHV